MLYDLTNKKQFTDDKEEIEELIYCSFLEGMDSNIILVGTKADLIAERQVSEEEMQTYAKKLGVPYIETSAKLDLNVKAAFSTLANGACNRLAQQQAMPKTQQSVSSAYSVEHSKTPAPATPWQKVLATLGLRPKTPEAQGLGHK